MQPSIDPEVGDRLRRELRLPGPLIPFARGSVLVGHSGDAVLKLFMPGEEAHARAEADCLRALAGRLPVATPELRASGSFEDHPYVLMSRLPGRELYELWPELGRAEREELGRQLGELMLCLGRVPPPCSLPRPEWEGWCAERSAGLQARQRRFRVEPALIDALPAFLAQADLREGERGTGLTHTEIMLDHLLVAPTERGWRLTGLFDFEPAMVLPLDYELSSVGIFFGGGEASVFRAVLVAAGVDPDRPGLARRIMALFLMHRYCNLRFALERTGADPSRGLGSLAEQWFRA